MGILLLNSDSGKMRVLIIVAAFVALAAAGEKKAAKSGKGYGHKSRFIGTTTLTIGLKRKCGNDGFYYNDANSFVICSNGNAYYQPCAPGSKNKGHSHYTHGGKYGVADFCGVNLVDYGYGAHKGGYGHSHGHSHGNRGHCRTLHFLQPHLPRNPRISRKPRSLPRTLRIRSPELIRISRTLRRIRNPRTFRWIRNPRTQRRIRISRTQILRTCRRQPRILRANRRIRNSRTQRRIRNPRTFRRIRNSRTLPRTFRIRRQPLHQRRRTGHPWSLQRQQLRLRKQSRTQPRTSWTPWGHRTQVYQLPDQSQPWSSSSLNINVREGAAGLIVSFLYLLNVMK